MFSVVENERNTNCTLVKCVEDARRIFRLHSNSNAFLKKKKGFFTPKYVTHTQCITAFLVLGGLLSFMQPVFFLYYGWLLFVIIFALMCNSSSLWRKERTITKPNLLKLSEMTWSLWIVTTLKVFHLIWLIYVINIITLLLVCVSDFDASIKKLVRKSLLVHAKIQNLVSFIKVNPHLTKKSFN